MSDIFDVASSTYLTLEDLDGRLLLIWAQGSKMMSGSDGEYLAIEARYVILDGEPLVDKAPSIPFETDGLFWAGNHVDKLKHRVGGRPILGRVDSRPSTKNKKVLAYGLREPSEADLALARKWIENNPVPDPFD